MNKLLRNMLNQESDMRLAVGVQFSLIMCKAGLCIAEMATIYSALQAYVLCDS